MLSLFCPVRPVPQRHCRVWMERSVRRYADIERFLRHQAEEAEHAGMLDVQSFWNDLKDVLIALRSEAQELQATLSPPDGMDSREELDALYCDLSRWYVQHLVAHGRYVMQMKGELRRR